MKKIFSLVVLFASVLMANAQSSLVATLHHDGSVKTFYTASALRDAHASAVHGDVITLSSGTFTSVDITKAITLRGAGMELDTITHTEPTVIAGDFAINIADSITQSLTIDGISHNHNITVSGELFNAVFEKSKFRTISGCLKNAQFVHCIIISRLSINGSSSVLCVSSMIGNPDNKSSVDISSFEFLNCMITRSVNYSTNDDFRRDIYCSTFRNCIIVVGGNVDNSRGTQIDESCAVYNCLGCIRGYNKNIFVNIPNLTNTYISNLNGVFRTYEGALMYDLIDYNFELTDDAKSKYLGDDGTQVGIYGGFLPYEPFSNKLRITRCNVANKSTADGKLSVDIEVKSAE